MSADVWKSETTLGRKRMSGLKRTECGGRADTVEHNGVQPALRPSEVIATRNTVFQDKSLMSQVAIGLKGRLISWARTKGKSHAGEGGRAEG